MTNDDKKVNHTVADDEIDLIELAKTIWNGRKLLIKTVLVFMVFGLLVALFSPKQYLASTTMVPQISNSKSKLGGLSSLAAMAGFNLDINTDVNELSPFVYPQIVQSVPFQLEIMNSSYTFSDVEKPVTLYEYFIEYAKPGFSSIVKKYTIGLPGVIISSLKGKHELSIDSVGKTIQITGEQEKVRKIIAHNLTLETNDKEGYVVLNSQFHEPKLAAEVAQKGQELLQKYIIEFKIEKASAQLAFINERHNEKKKEFQQAQSRLAAFIDRNKNVTSAVARIEEQRLQNEYKLAFDVYSNLAQQLEQAQIKVKEETPVFSVVKPVTVPLEKSKPKRSLILVIWTFMGGVVGLGWIFGKQLHATVKAKWNGEPPQKS